MNEESIRKKIDESWKEAMEKEKEQADRATDGQKKEIAASFSLFVLGMRVDCLIALGEVENPVDKTKSCDLDRAKYTIDILGIIQEKTKNNLAADESELLDTILYDLRMRYLSKTK